MIPGDIQPCGHQSPRPRIDLNPRAVNAPMEETLAEYTLRMQRGYEAMRIWSLVVSTAESSNVSEA